MKKAEKREQLDAQELMAHIDELLRILEEKHEIVELTYRGKVIGNIVPSQPASNEIEQQPGPEQLHKQKLKAFWADIDELANQIAAHSPNHVDAVQIVREGRRDL